MIFSNLPSLSLFLSQKEKKIQVSAEVRKITYQILDVSLYTDISLSYPPSHIAIALLQFALEKEKVPNPDLAKSSFFFSILLPSTTNLTERKDM